MTLRERHQVLDEIIAHFISDTERLPSKSTIMTYSVGTIQS